MMKVGVTGYKGRMGHLLVEAIETADDMSFAGGIDMGDDAQILFDEADIVIDFSVPDATITHARLAANAGTALIVGTTGLNEKQEQKAPTVRNKCVFYFAPLVLYFSFVSDIGRCPMLLYGAPLVLENLYFF